MRPLVRVTRLGPLIGAFALAAACGRSDSEPQAPLRDRAMAQVRAAQVSSLTDSARAALTRGNDAYRASRFDEALAAYREAARRAPRNAAPYFGILMAAQKLGNRPLADSASGMIRELSGRESPESVHTGGHPSTTAPATPRPKAGL